MPIAFRVVEDSQASTLRATVLIFIAIFLAKKDIPVCLPHLVFLLSTILGAFQLV